VRTAYRCRAYPDEAQQAVLKRTFGCVRVVWNRTLAARQACWHARRRGTSYAETDRALTAMNKEPGLAFLNEVSSIPLQQALRHQHQAFTAFFCKRARYPRFKSRRSRQSAHYTRSAFTMRSGELRLARTTAPLMFVWSWPDVDVTTLDPKMVIVSFESDGRWYVTFTIDTEAPTPPPTGHAVGVDLGVANFAVTSDGEKIANPRHLEHKARNLARYQRRLSRCQKGSRNRARAAAKVARAHHKVRNARRDFVIGRWYPSSKTCSACGYLLAWLNLGTRRWTCPSCGARHDRDVNAAKNILAAGRAASACGAGVRHLETPPVRPAVKQEPQPVTAGVPVLQGGE
jgi:putative transposase